MTHNRSLDGVLDQLNSKHMTDAGPVQLIKHDDADSDDELLPPGEVVAGPRQVLVHGSSTQLHVTWNKAPDSAWIPATLRAADPGVALSTAVRTVA